MYARHLEYTALSIGEALVTIKQLFFWLLGGFRVSNLRCENVPPDLKWKEADVKFANSLKFGLIVHTKGTETNFTMCKLTWYTKVLSGGDGMQPITFSFRFGQFFV
jgi:hypothetical protein